MIPKRRKTRQISVGNVKIGGSALISIQSMAKTDTRDIKNTVCQIKELQDAGCEIARVAVKDVDAAKAIRRIKQAIKIPLVADIHFDYKLALLSIQSGADKIRLNPGNISRREELEAVIKAAKARQIPIRIGVNSGSIRHPAAMVKAALGYASVFERQNFNDIIISLKASSVPETVEAYRIISKKCNYPLHLGITAAGLSGEGRIRSAVGMGALLLDGIGDTIRVSLTASPVAEVEAAKQILEAAGVRIFGPQIISCPTCGRCQVDLIKIAEELKDKLGRGNLYGCPNVRTDGRSPLQASLKIAIMGCEVNGPGEAGDADIGIAAGKESGMLFKKGKAVKKIVEKDFVKVLLKEIEKI